MYAFHMNLKDESESSMISLSFAISVEGGIEGVAVGAILSDYQRVRVENVCARFVLCRTMSQPDQNTGTTWMYGPNLRCRDP